MKEAADLWGDRVSNEGGHINMDKLSSEVQTFPERYSDEWFEMLQDWEGEHWKIVQEYLRWVEYREVQGRLQEFEKTVQHRIYEGG